MLVYTASKITFLDDVRSNRIEEIIENEVRRRLNKNSPRNEILSWKNSLQYMFNILADSEIPDSAGVAIEYNIPQSGKRVDGVEEATGGDPLEPAAVIDKVQRHAKASAR